MVPDMTGLPKYVRFSRNRRQVYLAEEPDLRKRKSFGRWRRRGTGGRKYFALSLDDARARRTELTRIRADTEPNVPEALPVPPAHELGGHRAPAMSLCFSPDGRFFAAGGEHGVQIANDRGVVVREFIGSHAVVPADTGPEFFVANHKGIVHWNAATNRIVREVGDWPPGWRPRFEHGEFRGSRSPTPHPISRVGHRNNFVLRRSGGPGESGKSGFYRSSSGTIMPMAAKLSGNVELYAVASRPRRNDFAVLLRDESACAHGGELSGGALQVHNARGELLERVGMRSLPRTINYSPDGRYLLVTDDRARARLLDADSLREIRARELRFRPDWCRFVDTKTLWMQHDGSIIRLDYPSLAERDVVELPGIREVDHDPLAPKLGEDHIHAVSLSPNRQRLVVSQGTDVILYRVSRGK